MESTVPRPSTPSTPLADTSLPSSRRNSCLLAFKRLSKNAWRRFGSSSKESRAHTPSGCDPPIEKLVVDDEVEVDNTPAPHDGQPESGCLEVDPYESCEFTFEDLPPAYFVNISHEKRLSALCAKYGLPYDGDAEKPAQYVNAPPGRLRVPKRTRQRIRTTCHLCGSMFKAEKLCPKCAHRKCPDCRRQPINESRSSIDKTAILVVDDGHLSSDDDDDFDHASWSTGDRDSRPVSAVVPPVPCPTRPPQPVIERLKHICHRCSKEFESISTTVCTHCGHEKCSHCSREVVHLSHPHNEKVEDPSSEPRQQRVFRPSRQRVRHYCDHCQSMFAPGARICGECLHTKCSNCIRYPNKRRRLDSSASNQDTTALQRVESHLASISIPAASTSETQDEPPQSL